jgi:hypothetical protein
MKYQIINLKNGCEQSVSESEFDKFMEEKKISNFHKFETNEKKIIYKNASWLLVPAE